MPVQQAFRATGQASVAVTTANVSVSGVVPGGGDAVLVYNASTADVAVAFDNQTATNTATTATASSPTIVPKGTRMLVTAGQAGLGLLAAAMPLATATGNVYFMRGHGSTY